MKKELLNEVKEAMKVEKQLDEKINELHELFEKLEKKDFNNGTLRQMQITSCVGTRPRMYHTESLLEMLKYAEQLGESENKPLSQIGKKVAEVCTEIFEGKYDGIIMTEFSSNPTYHPIKKLFTAFQNNYGLQSKLF